MANLRDPETLAAAGVDFRKSMCVIKEETYISPALEADGM